MRQTLFVPFAFLLSVAIALSANAAPPGETTVSVKFRTIQDFLVIVPIAINGAGPFNFLLDTGASRSVVDRKIADQLSLPCVAQSIAVGAEGTTSVSLVHVNSVSMGGSTVPGLTLTLLPQSASLPEKVSGVLGEDFLERFDLLLDYRHHVIELQSGDGPLAEALAGERLPIRLQGRTEAGPEFGRLILSAHAPELGRGEVSLLLDSGVNFLVLFGGRQSLGAGAIQQKLDIASPVQSSSGVPVFSRTINELRLGNKIVRNLTAFALPARPGMDTDGFMPTSAFGSIFISHSQKFVVLDPTTPTARRGK
jgi:predicted aspartyl protease